MELIERLEVGVADQLGSLKAADPRQRFRRRTFRDVEKLQVFRKAASPVAFRDVRRDRLGRISNWDRSLKSVITRSKPVTHLK